MVTLSVTHTGAIWVILGFIAFLRGPSALLGLLALASVFQGMAVLHVTFQSYVAPVIPYYWVATLISIRLWASVVLGAGIIRFPSHLRTPLFVLVGFALYSTISVVVLPVLFEEIQVYDPRMGIDEQYMNLSHLQFSSSMVGQVMLLWLNVSVLFYSAVAASSNKSLPLKLSRYIELAGAFVGAVTLIQFIAWITGSAFPYKLFFNVEGWHLGFSQYINQIRRMSGTFTEPSNLAAFLSGLLLYLFYRLTAVGGQSGQKSWLLFVFAVSVIALILTTSTTAYVGFGMLLIILVFYGVVKGSHDGKVSRLSVFASVLLFGTILAASISMLFFDPVKLVAFKALFEKTQSGSFIHRVAADRHALWLVFETAGLGVGLGGNRASSFFTTLLSNVGLFGTALFTLMLTLIVAVLRRIRKYCRSPHLPAGFCHMGAASSWALFGTLLAKVISQPDIAFPPLWIWLVFLVVVSGGISATPPR